MHNSTITMQPLISVLWPSTSVRVGLVRVFIMAVAGSLLLTLSAKIQVPFWPVPMTFQTFAVLIIGMAYGLQLGGVTVALYLAEGAAGLPVFAGTPAKGIGLAYLAGPTGGYLVGFLLAALLVGWLAERSWDRNVFKTALAMLLGNALIYVPGLLWLGYLIGFSKAVQFGFTPFLMGDALKLVLAAAFMPLAWKVISRFKESV